MQKTTIGYQANNSSLVQNTTLKAGNEKLTEVIISIIEDSILWSRVNFKMIEFSQTMFDEDDKYTGYYNAFRLMGIDKQDHDILEPLSTHYLEAVDYDMEIDARTQAQNIYFQWSMILYYRGKLPKAKA